ncbi:hypothetical protein BN59_00892 [Legionella massiliensis]|uniref:Uncharacterized protein n=1 Tax=Legionella massiliensis TaxID=1034943 RepID=A0A078KY03_9GAMM|nr:hypothetical protein [Legionella massiliensis]CDZ76618.1 hypothetical protein BN59_00892 [Legionella massiliensis]CEE12356.1 hypothetical protein BN1094_00892 [Legionella massiliensis]
MPLSKEQKETLLKNLYNPRINGNFISTLCIDPPIPAQDPLMDQEKAKAWISLHSQGISRQCAEKIISNTVVFSFEEFYIGLQESVVQLNQLYKDGKIDANQSIIVVPHTTGRKELLGARKSQAWVASLALTFLEFTPYQIVDHSYLTPFLKTHPDVKRLIFLDDTAYSGTDMSAYISKCETYGLTVDFIIPFLTNTALSKFKQSNDKLNLFYSRIIPVITEMDFTTEELDYLRKHRITGDTSSLDLSRITLTIHAHKKADSYSIAEKILTYGFPIEYPKETRDKIQMLFSLENNSLQDDNSLQRVQFIPDVSPPYKLQEPLRFLSHFISTTVSVEEEGKMVNSVDSDIKVKNNIQSNASNLFFGRNATNSNSSFQLSEGTSLNDEYSPNLDSEQETTMVALSRCHSVP